jgi:DNA-directed RNA polymerase subunit RPC12/RpoP
LEGDPNNIYAKRYDTLISSKLVNDDNLGKIPKIMGKQLKCPHCESKISYSALNEEQKQKIDSSEYNNLEIKCPYCHSNFVLQRLKANSII